MIFYMETLLEAFVTLELNTRFQVHWKSDWDEVLLFQGV